MILTVYNLRLGRAAGAPERQFALENGILRQAAASIVTVEEGKETTDFWDALGGPLSNVCVCRGFAVCIERSV